MHKDLHFEGDTDTGPLLATFGRRGWTAPQPPTALPDTIRFGRNWRKPIGYKPFLFAARLEPPPWVDLFRFGCRVAELANLSEPARPEAHHRAIFLAGGIWAVDAAHATSLSMSILSRRLADVEVVQLALMTWRAER